MKHSNFQLLLAILVVAVLVGCAGTKVTDATAPSRTNGAPSMIYVGEFDLGAAKVKSDPGTLTGRPRLLHFGERSPTEEIHRLSELLAKTLVEDLKKEGFAARRLEAGETPASGWIVRGAFVSIDEGNRAQKAVLGFGAGTSETKLAVGVIDAAKSAEDNLLNFNLDSQGDKTPSGVGPSIAFHNPLGMAAKFALNGDASDKDIERTAGEIAKQLKRLATTSPATPPTP